MKIQVEFGPEGKRYTYRYPYKDVVVGDLVVCPVSRNGDKAKMTGRVAAIGSDFEGTTKVAIKYQDDPDGQLNLRMLNQWLAGSGFQIHPTANGKRMKICNEDGGTIGYSRSPQAAVKNTFGGGFGGLDVNDLLKLIRRK
jgi:hypothetical protein